MLDRLGAALAGLPPAAVYAVLFGLFLFQTGFLLGPVIPGNPLLFAAGVASAPGAAGSLPRLDPILLALVTGAGVFAGNLINYGQGRRAGPAVARRPRYAGRVADAEAFFARRGSATVALAAFLPFIRAFVPFVAGMGRMAFRPFALASLVGAFAWTGAWTALGHFLGRIPVVAENANRIVIGIVVVVSVVAVAKVLASRRKVSA